MYENAEDDETARVIAVPVVVVVPVPKATRELVEKNQRQH